jgi:hypothetical protein
MKQLWLRTGKPQAFRVLSPPRHVVKRRLQDAVLLARRLTAMQEVSTGIKAFVQSHA